MKKVAVFCIIIVSFIFSAPLWPCTLWAVAGSVLSEGGTMIAKNRDWTPDHTQYLRLVRPESGYSYLGLFTKGNAVSGIKAGVNEFGLTVISATAGSIPKVKRKKFPRKKKLIQSLLKSCRSVDEVLAKKKWFLGPRFLMAADKGSAVVIEIGPAGKINVKRADNGYLCHTNHFLAPEFLELNKKKSQSSLIRWDRISTLLRDSQKPLHLADFIQWSEDRNAGPNNSLWRTGDNGKTRTLASWIVSLPKAGLPIIYVKIANPGEKENLFHFRLEEVFSDSGKFPVIEEKSLR